MVIVRSVERLIRRPTLWIVMLWAAAVAARFVRSGAVYDLDYSLLHPDGTLYHTLTLRFLGMEWSDISAQVAAFYQQHSLQDLPAGWPFNAASPKVGLVYTRPMYSLLSVPFVAIGGPWGMLAVPILSLLVVGLVLVAIGRRMQAEWPAVLVFGCLTFSTTVMRWSVSNLTDTLQFAFVAIAGAMLVANRDRLWLMLPVAAGLLTRPSGPIWIALLLPFALREADARRKYFAVMAIAVTGTAFLILSSPIAVGISLTDAGPLIERLLGWAWHSIAIPVTELGQLAVLDRPLLALLAAAIVLSLRRLDDPWAQAFLLVFATTMLMGSWVGVMGVNFRYQLPCLVPASVVVMRFARDCAWTRTAPELRSVPTNRVRGYEAGAAFQPRRVEDVAVAASARARKTVAAR